MKDLLERFRDRRTAVSPRSEDELRREINALCGVFVGLIGAERIVMEAGRYNALVYLHTDNPRERLAGLARMVFEDEDIPVPTAAETLELMERTEDRLTDLLIQQAVEERLESKVNDRIEERNQEYMRELRLQILAEETGETETPRTREKLRELEAKERVSLTKTVAAQVRPETLSDLVGQEEAVAAMLAKVATKYPQHLILYGPPGVGKTTAARLVLETAKGRGFTPFGEEAPFVEADGTTLRWDPRDITNPLIGSVHDPIYQGAQRELAEQGVPEPKPGLVTKAHGGILFIDEIGEMDPMLLNKLLKVLEDKRVYFESAYYNEDEPQVAEYIRRLFRDGAPADFILIGATTRLPEEINPAIRSRCAEVYFAPLTPVQVERIVVQAAAKLAADTDDDVPAAIASYTEEGRKAVNLLADAYGMALYEQGNPDRVHVTAAHVKRVARTAHLSPERRDIASTERRIGHVFGLGVAGYRGSTIEVEAVAVPAREAGKGKVRFNSTAGSMAKDSVFNATAVLRMLTGQDADAYDIHVNVIGGGQIDGPSAGTAIACAIMSAVTQTPLRQDVALTGEIALSGAVKPIGGVLEKAGGAARAGMKKMLIPVENTDEIATAYADMRIVRVATVAEAWKELTEDDDD